MDRVTIIEGEFSHARAAQEYSRAFAEAGLGVLKDPPETAGARLRASPIREQLAAALDSWAWTVFR